MMATLDRTLSNDLVAGNGFFAGLANTMAVWKARIAARRELAGLTFRDIQEIGLDQAKIDQEIAKPFWQA